MSTEQYQAGICNIGGPEVARRKQVAYLGGGAFLFYSIYILLQGSAVGSAIYAFIPAMIFSIGFIQSRKKFCLAYGLLGTFNFQKLGSISKVTDKQALAADRRTAATIILQAIGLALTLTMAVVLLSTI